MTGDDAAWTELRLEVPLSAGACDSEAEAERFLEPLCTVARRWSPGGVVIEGDDAPPGDDPVQGTVRVRLWVTDAEAEAARADVAVAASAFSGAALTTRPLDPDWREHWKRWFVGFDASPRLRVRPPWEAAAVGGRHEVVIEPGMAFGTGQHATTRLCLQALDALCGETPPDRLLDVGCGTGILSIAVARLGVGEVLGLDNDPDAVRLARDNADVNGVTAACRFEETPVGELAGTWPVVVANILAHILDALADDIAARVAPGGCLLMSGALTSQADDLEARYVAAGLVPVSRAVSGEWTRLELTRP